MYLSCLVLSSISRTNNSVLCFPWCVFLSLLIGEMEGKERDHEETKKFKENRPENYHVHDMGWAIGCWLKNVCG